MAPLPIVLSVAICTHDRSRALGRCLAALARRNEVETIVVDSGSSAGEADAIRAAAATHGARHIRLTWTGLSAARNAALAAARGRWIAYLDDDATPAANWCDVLLATIARDPGLAATGGPILPLWQAQLPGWWPPSLRAALTIIDDASWGVAPEPYAANIAFRREALTRFGGFPACLGRRGAVLMSNEETYILRRFRKHGLSVRFTPELVVHHEITRERLRPDWLIERQYWSGVSEAVMLGALGERRLGRIARLALHAIVLAPFRLWPPASTRCLAFRCRAAFATGFLRGACGAAPNGALAA